MFMSTTCQQHVNTASMIMTQQLMCACAHGSAQQGRCGCSCKARAQHTWQTSLANSQSHKLNLPDSQNFIQLDWLYSGIWPGMQRWLPAGELDHCVRSCRYRYSRLALYGLHAQPDEKSCSCW